MKSPIAEALEGWHAPGEGLSTIALFSELRKLTLSVVIRVLLGTELAPQLAAVADSFVTALEETNRRMISPIPYLPWLYGMPTRDNLAFRRAAGYLSKVVDEIIRRRESTNEPASTDLPALIVAAQLAEDNHSSRVYCATRS